MNRQASISALGSYLPEKIITNLDLEKIIDTDDEWIKSRTGISERRRVSSEESTSEIAVKACSNALLNFNTDPKEIELLICTSLSPDKLCPSTASIIQDKLKLENAAAFDLASACSGFSYALTTAVAYVNSNMYKKVLIVGAEAISRFLNYKDRNTCILFGDGAGAAIVEFAEKPYGVLASYLAADGSKSDLIEIPAGGSVLPASEITVEADQHYLRMKGQEVFKFAVRIIPLAIDNVLKKANLKIEDVDLIIPHQANLRIIEAASRKLDINLDKFFINLEFLGNTSTASIPLALEQAINDKRLKKGDIVVVVGFGAGLSWGANVIRWSF